MKVLIVDDDVVDRLIIIKALSSIHVHRKITETSSVSEGLAAIEQDHFDVILLDYKMPEADGIEMLYELRTKPNLGNSAVVMVSASEDNDLALRCIEAGAQDFIVKSELSEGKLNKAILHAQKRFEIERKMHDSYVNVKKMAERDPLTGLSNRYHFDETLKVMIANNKRTTHSVALLALDLDNFKHINDTLGHDAGDLALIEMVNRINDCLRQNEGFARVGGDEFAIILGGLSSVNEVSNIADRILDTFSSPFVIKTKEVQCSISIGVAVFPADALSAKDLIKSADIAMYRAKQSGKNRVCFYETKYQDEFNRRVTIQSEINAVLKKESFTLHFQPLFNIDTEKVTSFEALIRWPEDAKTQYTPDEFIPIAEETHQIGAIGKWVFDSAVSQLKKWHLQYGPYLSMSINVSPVQLRDTAFVDFVKATLNKYDIPADRVTVEITETALFNDHQKIKECLQSLAIYGVNIALDDFGMGYSSISHLTAYPINIVKIDKSLQSLPGSSPANEAMFEALALMLSKLNFKTVAEGVETQEQLALCRKYKIDRIQGFLLGKPLPPEQINKYLN